MEKDATISFSSRADAEERKEHAENSLGMNVELIPPEGESIESHEDGSDSIPEKEVVEPPDENQRADGGQQPPDEYDKLEWEHEAFRLTIDITVTPLGERDE